MRKLNVRNLIGLVIVLAMVTAACGAGADNADDSEVRFDTTATTETPGAATYAGTEATTAARTAETSALNDGSVLDAQSYSGSEEATATRALRGDDNAQSGADAYEPEVEDPPTDVFARNYGTNPFVRTADDSLSTFALDVDTGSYTLVRNWIEARDIPPAELVRVEEFVNYFDQEYPAPVNGTFAVYADGAPTPFTASSRNHIVRIGIKAREVAEAARPDAILTFVVDVSGSMREGDRIGMVKSALTTLVDELRTTDSVAIVAYDRSAWVVLQPTQAWKRDTIISAINRLEPGGSTNAEAGLTLGYDLAEASFVEGLINRVILASDGVANVGSTDAGGILWRIGEQASIGINLAAIGGRPRQLQRRAAGTTRRHRRRVLCLRRLSSRGRATVRRRPHGHPADSGRGGQGVGQLQPGDGRVVPPDRVRKPGHRRQPVPRRPGRCRRDRCRTRSNGSLRGAAGRARLGAWFHRAGDRLPSVAGTGCDRLQRAARGPPGERAGGPLRERRQPLPGGCGGCCLRRGAAPQPVGRRAESRLGGGGGQSPGRPGRRP